jgi:hypothetical protein
MSDTSFRVTLILKNSKIPDKTKPIAETITLIIGFIIFFVFVFYLALLLIA